MVSNPPGFDMPAPAMGCRAQGHGETSRGGKHDGFKSDFQEMYDDNMKSDIQSNPTQPTPPSEQAHPPPQNQAKDQYDDRLHAAESRQVPLQKVVEREEPEVEPTKVAEAESAPAADSKPTEKTKQPVPSVLKTEPFVDMDKIDTDPETTIDKNTILERRIAVDKQRISGDQPKHSLAEAKMPEEGKDKDNVHRQNEVPRMERGKSEDHRQNGVPKVTRGRTELQSGLDPEVGKAPSGRAGESQPKTKTSKLVATQKWSGRPVFKEDKPKISDDREAEPAMKSESAKLAGKASAEAILSEKIETREHGQVDGLSKALSAVTKETGKQAEAEPKDTAQEGQQQPKSSLAEPSSTVVMERDLAERVTASVPKSIDPAVPEATAQAVDGTIPQASSAETAGAQPTQPAASIAETENPEIPGEQIEPVRPLEDGEEEVVIVRPKSKADRAKKTSVASEMLSTMPLKRSEISIPAAKVYGTEAVEQEAVEQNNSPTVGRTTPGLDALGLSNTDGAQPLDPEALENLKPSSNWPPPPKVPEPPQEGKLDNLQVFTNGKPKESAHPQELLEQLAKTKDHYRNLRAQPQQGIQKGGLKDVEVTSTINLPRGLDGLKKHGVKPKLTRPTGRPLEAQGLPEQARQPSSQMAAAKAQVPQAMPNLSRAASIAELAQMINDRIKAGPVSDTSVRFSMDFSSNRLGNVSISVENNSGQLNIVLQADNSSSRQQLTDQRDEVARQLRLLGYDQVNVEVDDKSDSQQNAFEEQGDENPDKNVRFYDDDGNKLEDLG